MVFCGSGVVGVEGGVVKVVVWYVFVCVLVLC